MIYLWGINRISLLLSVDILTIISMYINALKDKVSHYTVAEKELIERAFYFADEAHSEQKRQSGERYIMHPVAVAMILADMKLDVASVVTGLLHDTVEDTSITLQDIETQFGSEVAHLVRGVTKLSKIELSSKQSKQAENFRKLVLAMSDDIRVLLVKLIDRLHNMRTLHFMHSPESKKRIASETMEIYAPLAERIGMRRVMDELHNLSFKNLHFEAYESLDMRLKRIEAEGEGQLKSIVQSLETTLQQAGIRGEVSGRRKTPYSIWRKMQRKNVSFEQISDINAFRVILHSVADCYQALGAIHNEYLVVPGRFKDYISTPKPNHYQSLHTTVIVGNQCRIEVQIRTAEMEAIAKYGVAAHWEYKQEGVSSKDGRQYKWLQGLLEILNHTPTPDEFLEHTKLEMFQDQVFCFTPKGDLISLPSGATCIDFAYAVHSDVGNHCTGAKINCRLMPLRTELQNGDQIEIITSPNHDPSPTWERFVVTGKARASIRRYIRSKQQSEFLELGAAIIKKACRQHEVPFSKKLFEGKIDPFNCETFDELCVAVGRGEYTAHDVARQCFPKDAIPRLDGEKIEQFSLPLLKARSRSNEKTNVSGVAIRGLVPGMAIHYAACCHPLPGDRISGVVVTGTGITIHTIECETLLQYQDQPERLLDVSWDDTELDTFIGRIFMILRNKPGSLGKVSAIIGATPANIVNLKITRRADDFFDLYVDVNVQSVDELNKIMATLRTSPIVSYVERR